MAEVLLPDRTTEETAVEPPAKPIGPKAKARLARMIAERVAAGYRIESQSELQALLVKVPTQWLGSTPRGREKREIVSINQWGYPRIQRQ
jgi:hypothetical protein